MFGHVDLLQPKTKLVFLALFWPNNVGASLIHTVQWTIKWLNLLHDISNHPCHYSVVKMFSIKYSEVVFPVPVTRVLVHCLFGFHLSYTPCSCFVYYHSCVFKPWVCSVHCSVLSMLKCIVPLFSEFFLCYTFLYLQQWQNS